MRSPLGAYGIAHSQLERIGYNPLEAQGPLGEPLGGGGGGGFGFSLGQSKPRISLGFAEKDYVGPDDTYTGAGRRGAGSFGFGGSNHNVEAYKKLSPEEQKAFTDNYMKNNRYSNVSTGGKWAKPVAAPLASRIIVGGRGRGGRGGITRVARSTPSNSYSNYSRRVGRR